MNNFPDLSSLLDGATPETMEGARAKTIALLMSRQQALAEQFSKIDHPFVTEDAQDDYALAKQEYEALIKCAVFMPQSVEGIRFLEGWHTNRMTQIKRLVAHTAPGAVVAFGAGSEPYTMTEDFAKGMFAALTVVQSMFRDFPLTLTVDDEPEADPPA